MGMALSTALPGLIIEPTTQGELQSRQERKYVRRRNIPEMTHAEHGVLVLSEPTSNVKGILDRKVSCISAERPSET